MYNRDKQGIQEWGQDEAAELIKVCLVIILAMRMGVVLVIKNWKL